MSPARPTLLLTRPAAASHRFADAFRVRFGDDWPIVVAPLMETRWLAPPLEASAFDGVVFTSERAVHGLCRLTGRRDMTAWCVGERTARAAEEAGFEPIAGPGDAAGLARLLAVCAPGTRLLWPRGSEVAHDLVALVPGGGPVIVPVVVYAQDPAPPSKDALACLAGRSPVLVPLFSARSARLFVRFAQGAGASFHLAAISAPVAEVAGGLKPARLVIAASPDSEGLLDALGTLLHPGRDG